jgi:hypothetical protein
LFNGGEFAFNPAQWGKEIIFEKRILQSGATNLDIKGLSGKRARDPQGYKAQYIYIWTVSLASLKNVFKGCPIFR